MGLLTHSAAPTTLFSAALKAQTRGTKASHSISEYDA